MRRGGSWILAGLLAALLAAGTARGAALEVIVSDGEGHPVAGARLLVFGSDGPAVARAKTGPGGRARLADLPGGARWLLALADGAGPAAVDLSPPVPDPVRVSLPATEPLDLRILDAARGAPLPAARVIVSPLGRAFVEQPWLGLAAARRVDVRPDPETGKVHLPDVPAGPVALLVAAPGHRPRFLPERPAPGASVELDREGCRRVRVVEENSGRPVPGARILPARMAWQVRQAGGGGDLLEAVGRLSAVGETSRDGTAVVCPLPSQGNRFTVIAEGYPPADVELPAGAGTEEIVRLPAGARVVVRVVDEGADSPVPGMTVRLAAGETVLERLSGPAGIARFGAVPANRSLAARVVGPDGTVLAESVLPPLRPGAEETEVLRVTPTLRLLVEDGDGEPLADVPVTLLGPGREDEGGIPPSLGEARTDGDGIATFYLGRGIPGDALLVLRWGDALIARPVPSPADPDRPLAPRPVVLAGRRVRVRVVAEGTGLPVEGAVLRCLESGDLALPGQVAARPGTGPLAIAGEGKTELLPRGEGVIAVADRDGEAEVPLPAACDGLRAEGPVEEHTRYRHADLVGEDLDAAEEETATIELPVASGIVVDPRASGPVPARVRIEVRDAADPRRVLRTAGGPPRPRDVPLPPGRVALVVVRAAGYAPAVLGPLAGDADWPTVPALLVPGGEVRVSLPPGLVPGGDGSRLVDETGLDWWPIAARREEGAVEEPQVVLGPLPPGRYELELAGGACRESFTVHGPGEPAVVSCR